MTKETEEMVKEWLDKIDDSEVDVKDSLEIVVSNTESGKSILTLVDTNEMKILKHGPVSDFPGLKIISQVY